MPIYEYTCGSCGKTIDVLQKISDPAPEACTECGAQGSLSRLVSRTSFVLKGGGWYADLYSSTKKDGGSKETSSSSESSNSSSSSPTSSSSTSSSPTSSSPSSSSSSSGSSSSGSSPSSSSSGSAVKAAAG